MRRRNEMNATLQIQVTDICNLKCPYCYVKQRKNVLTFDMFLKQYEKLDTLFEKFTYYNPDYSKFEIGYFGGEPLLNLDTIIEIDKFLTKENRKAFSHIQTNGTIITKEIVNKLDEYHIDWSYSYDGLWQDPKVYNHREISNLDMRKRIKEDIFAYRSPKIMIGKTSINTLLENYKYFESIGIINPDFTLVRDDIWDENDFVVYDKKLGELVDYLIERTIATKQVHSIGLIDLYFADTIAGKKWGKRSFGCFSGSNGVVITPVGVIYPCTRFYSNDKFPLYDCINDICYEDNINFLQSVSDPRKHKKCQNCKLYQYCNVGCSYSTLEKNDFKSQEPIDSVCEMFKISYKYTYKFYKAISDKVNYLEYVGRRYFNG